MKFELELCISKLILYLSSLKIGVPLSCVWYTYEGKFGSSQSRT